PSDSGIEVTRFPELFRCKNCGRLSDSNNGNCQCGNDSRAQLPFVSFHRCGRAETPWIPTCPTHNQVRLRRLPGTTRTADLSIDGFIAIFEAQGFDTETARAMAEAAAAQAGNRISSAPADLKLSDEAREEAFEAALKLAYAVSGGRVRLDELADRSGPGARAR